MILRNHGLLTVGRTMGEAFTNMHALEKAAEAQLKAQASGARFTVLSKEVCEHTARQHQRRRGVRGTRDLRALRALLDARSEEHPSELQSLMRISYAVFCLKQTINRSGPHGRSMYNCEVQKATPTFIPRTLGH